ncbi:hypothetical protein NL676_008900 [Syzygium grande]|nr:hypothetical protein NL676_008900 [Syzygium grande]
MRASPLHSPIRCSSPIPSPPQPPSPPPPPPPSSVLTSTTTQLATKLPRSLLHQHPLYTPTHPHISLHFKEKILCLEIMGIDVSQALALKQSLCGTSPHFIHSVVSFLPSKGIHQKDLANLETFL